MNCENNAKPLKEEVYLYMHIIHAFSLIEIVKSSCMQVPS